MQINVKKQLGPLTLLGEKNQKIFNMEKTSAIWLGNKQNSPVKYKLHLHMVLSWPTFKILSI